jgi:thioredoxin 2
MSVSSGAPVVPCPSCGSKNRLRPGATGARCGRCHQPLVAAPRGEPVTVTDQTFAAEVEGASLPVLVDFWAPWCGPCRAVAPLVEALARDRAGRLKVAKVDVDQSPELARRFSIQAIPTLALFRGGRLVEQLRGAPGRAALEAMVDRAAGATPTRAPRG